MSDSHLTTNTCYLPEGTILGENFLFWNIILLIRGYSASFPGLPPLPVLLIVWVTPSNWSLVVLLPFILFPLAFSFGSVSDYRNLTMMSY